MSSKASTTIGFERRFNRRSPRRTTSSWRRHRDHSRRGRPTWSAIVELNRGPFLGAQPRLQELDIALDDAVVLDVRDSHAFAAGHRPGAVNVPVSGSSFGDEGRVRPPGAADRHRRRRRDRGAPGFGAPRGGRRLRPARVARSAAAPSSVEPVTIDELERRLAADEIVLVRRSRSGRARRPASSRAAVTSRTATRVRPRRTACAASGRSSRSARAAPRAAIAASVLHAAGLDARPVLDGGIDRVAGARRRDDDVPPLRS